MRASFTMTKLAIQYFTLHNCVDKKEIIRTAKKLFPDFNFNTLETNLQLINTWSQIKKCHQLDNILELTDLFIEEFSHYILKIIREGRKLNRD